MIEIPVVYESNSPSNVWKVEKFAWDVLSQHHSRHFKVDMPWLLQGFQPHIKIINPSQIENVDWFIYPVLMHEPYFQLRSLIGYRHPDYGFWSFVPNKVIESLTKGKGWILIDATMEPFADIDLEEVLKALENCSEFPNNRIIINSPSLKHLSHPQVVNLPSFLEMHFCCRHLFGVDPETPLEGGLLKRKDIYVAEFNELEPEEAIFRRPPIGWVKENGEPVDILQEKRFCSFQMRWNKHKGCANLLVLLDKLDLFKKGYVTADLLDDFFNDYRKVKGADTQLISFNNSSNNLLHVDDILDPVDFVAGYIKKSGFNIVTEAYYNDDDLDYQMITEKIWRNISYKKPFVLIGQRGTLKKFNILGYKSFSPYIDESYDRKGDSDRFFHAFLQAKKLINMSDSEFNTLLSNVEDIHLHNQRNFENRLTKIYQLFLDLKRNDNQYSF